MSNLEFALAIICFLLFCIAVSLVHENGKTLSLVLLCIFTVIMIASIVLAVFA